MLLLQASIKVFIDIIVTVAFILLIEDKLFNDRYLLKPFKFVNITLSHSIVLLLMIFDQLRDAILLAESDIKIKAKSQGWEGTLANNGWSWRGLAGLVWWLTFRNYLLAIHPLNELASSNSLMP